MLEINFVKEKLKAGSSVIGMWSIINSPMVVEIAATAGLDFQILDMEHGMFDLTSLATCIKICESLKCSPLVRLPAGQLSLVQNCLDLGAHGLLLPQVNDYHEVNNFVQATKFPPIGSRGFNPFTPAAHFNPTSTLRTKLSDDFGLTSLIIENKQSYQALNTILTIQHLDLLYLGVYDMSVELGCAGDVNHPSVIQFLESSIHSIKKAGKISGVMALNQTDMQKYLEMGVNFIVYGVDTNNYYRAIKQGISLFNAVEH